MDIKDCVGAIPISRILGYEKIKMLLTQQVQPLCPEAKTRGLTDLESKTPELLNTLRIAGYTDSSQKVSVKRAVYFEL